MASHVAMVDRPAHAWFKDHAGVFKAFMGENTDFFEGDCGVWFYAHLYSTPVQFNVNCWWTVTNKVVRVLVFELKCLDVIGLMALL